jgi:hypothetical protein
MFSSCAVPNVVLERERISFHFALSMRSVKVLRQRSQRNEDSSVENGTACCGHAVRVVYFRLVVLQVMMQGREKIEGKFRLAVASFFPVLMVLWRPKRVREIPSCRRVLR